MKIPRSLGLGLLGAALIPLGCQDSNSVAGPEGGGRRTYSISGTVASGENPIGGARVELVSQGVAASTNFYGEYNLVGVPEGTVLLTVSASGYEKATRRVTVGPNAYDVDFDLAAVETGPRGSFPPPRAPD
ncbi:MAG TPA: carboxypeptidase regulatory-like domain-containing protein [Thermoanaerobaculia bacterium]|nr:carboxypeptidase regulatory-like domain-containing protein [Thermoanaerobaculia bacterium]